MKNTPTEDIRCPRILEIISPIKGEGHVAFWIFISAVIGALAHVLTRTFHAPVFTEVGIPLIVGMALIPVVVNECTKRLERLVDYSSHFLNAPKEVLTRWFYAEFASFQSGTALTVSAICFCALSIAAFGFSGAFNGEGAVAAIILLLLPSVFAAWGIFALFCLARIIWRMGEFHVVVEDTRFGIRQIGQLMGFTYMLAALNCLVYSISATANVQNRAALVYGLASPCILLICGLFVGCQYPIHRRMVDFKYAEVRRLRDVLSDIVPSRGCITEEMAITIEFLERKLAAAESLPEWPFDFGTMVSSWGAVLGSMIPIVLPLFEGWFKSATGFWK